MKVIQQFLAWSLVRKLQAFFGTILLIGFAGDTTDFTSLGFGLFFMAQAVFNWGCAMQSCASPASRTGSAPGKEEDVLVSYEEVHGK